MGSNPIRSTLDKMNEQKFHVGVKALVLNENNEILLLRINPKDQKTQSLLEESENKLKEKK